MKRAIGVSEAKARFSELARRAAEKHECIRITKNGKPFVVLVSEEDWNGRHDKSLPGKVQKNLGDEEQTFGEALGDIVGAWAGKEHDYWDDILKMLDEARYASHGTEPKVVFPGHKSLRRRHSKTGTRRKPHLTST